MHSRVTLFEIDTVRFDLDAAVARFDQLVLPDLRDQPGYAGVYVLASKDGKGLVMTLWDSEAAADEQVRTGFYAAQVERFVTFFSSPPGRESYEIVLADAPAFAPD